jgi:hypothetical protein
MDADADATMTSEVVHVNQASAAMSRRTQSLGARSRRSLDPDVIAEDPNLPGTRPWGRDCLPRHEAAVELGVTRQPVHQLIRKGRLGISH